MRSYPSHAIFASNARRDLRAYAEACGAVAADVDDLAVALGEVLVFAVQPGGGGFVVSARRRDNTIEVTVENNAGRFENPPPLRDAGTIPLTPRGYSMQIIRKLMDSVTFGDGGKRIRFIKRLRG